MTRVAWCRIAVLLGLLVFVASWHGIEAVAYLGVVALIQVVVPAWWSPGIPEWSLTFHAGLAAGALLPTDHGAPWRILLSLTGYLLAEGLWLNLRAEVTS